ncbi:MAG: helix-turn-helix domain-containing protein [Cytophagales bacterium]
MKHLSILVPQGSSVVDTIIGPYNLFKMANKYHQKLNGLTEPLFYIDLVGINDKPVTYQQLFAIQPTNTIESIEKTDLIIISPISGDLEKNIATNQSLIDWIKKQRISNDAELASLCKGAFLLAETGLLNGKDCATHWTAHDLFRLKYPEVNLIPESIICEANGIYSSGGAYSILNFMLYLIERFFGRETAIWTSKISEIEFDRVNQNEFIIFSGQKEHQDGQIAAAQSHIENNYNRKLNITDIADQIHLNSRSFQRRFKKATSNTPLEYIQRVRVEAAKKKLESTAENILEVMYGVGYNDEKAFRKTFRKYTGLSPKEYQMKYNREAAFA